MCSPRDYTIRQKRQVKSTHEIPFMTWRSNFFFFHFILFSSFRWISLLFLCQFPLFFLIWQHSIRTADQKVAAAAAVACNRGFSSHLFYFMYRLMVCVACMSVFYVNDEYKLFIWERMKCLRVRSYFDIKFEFYNNVCR